MRSVSIVCGLLCAILTTDAGAAGPLPVTRTVEQDAPDAAAAAALLGVDAPVSVVRQEQPLPGWAVSASDRTVGYIGSTWEISGSIGYSGKPIDILVAVTPDARLSGAKLMRHNEPILTLGLSADDIARFVSGFAGLDLTKSQVTTFEAETGVPDVISRATVTSGVIRDAILRTARTLALGYGLAGGSGIDRVTYRETGWDALAAKGALAHTRVSLDEARAALTSAKIPPPEGDGAFLDLWAAILDPPAIGRNLLGQLDFTKAVGTLAPGETALFVASRGLHSHRGTAWRRSGTFDRIAVEQNGKTFEIRKDDYQRIDRLAAPGAPEFKEMSLFRLHGEGFDATRPFRIVVSASREGANGDVTMRIPLDYALPADFLTAPAPLAEPEPLWISAWQSSKLEIAGVTLMLTVLAGLLFFQEAFVRRPKLWRTVRAGFLTVTLVWLGWIAGGQLSVVQVVAFLQSLLSGFRWETFLIEPVIFLLWGFVALGLLFWGRGVFCGWLCPFGALQELTNRLAQRLGVPQVSIPYAVHERLWVIKYTLFVAIVALSFYSMEHALVLAEAEPFKTAMSMRFMRAWPFVLFVAALLIAGLFIERFYCRYLCPLGAGLAIPAKLKLFDWLRRRPQCGRECRLCEQKCPVGAIDPIGRINPNECVLCLRCQTIYHDPETCTVLKARAARQARSKPSPVA